ncbi:MAG: D-2-hydroxyacid dehydrogenase [Cytophagaceae bacterium]
MNIVFVDMDTMGEMKELNLLKKLGNLTVYESTTPDQVVDRSKDADVVITNKVVYTKKVIDALPKLKLICVAATGTNNIDIVAATEKGIPVKNVKGYSTSSVVQLTFGVMLELMYQMNYYYDYVNSGKYSNQNLFTHIGPGLLELNGKTIGIIGMGDIGKGVAKVAEAFGMNVIHYSTSGKNTNSGYTSVSLSELAKQSDVVSIHAPLNDQTKGLIDGKFMEQMKSSAILINMGRGGIVVEKDLVAALDMNKIYGAALDVFEKEPLPKESSLLEATKKHRLLLTPHIAWAGYDSRVRLIEGIVKNIQG